VLFVCGSDEHGAAITLRALKEGTTPKAIVDKYHALMGKAFADFGHRVRHLPPHQQRAAQENFAGFFLGTEQERRFHGEHGRAVLRRRGQAIPRGPLHHRHLPQLRQSGCIRRSVRKVRQRAQPEGPHQPAQHTERQHAGTAAHQALVPAHGTQSAMDDGVDKHRHAGRCDAARSRRMETAGAGPMQQLAEGRIAPGP
jgi:hypothetical protein